ncbi:GT4 family glycosyltransferase PelF [Ferrovibrio sp.]|uniref:GT4 family glycosyltransferase PelF n=1 Tax=Ferrovibrio sp. TaxID=1917215 RepID=UPI003511D398
MSTRAPADICMILEGTYPYVAGGVSSWVHDMLRTHADRSFHLVCLLPDRQERQHRYTVPGNVVGIDHVYLQEIAPGSRPRPGDHRLFRRMESGITAMVRGGRLEDLARLDAALAPMRRRLGRRRLLNSAAAWQSILRLYERELPEASFLEFFWSWRSMMSSLFAVMLADIPPARLYHTISTGYAGALAARAHIATRRPVLVTEHGIYTNERRIEITMANWLHEVNAGSLALQRKKRDLRDLWIDSFTGYSHCTYSAASRIITLYGGNQDLQRRDGAPEDRLLVIPNGIDFDRFAAIPRVNGGRPPTIALIGRVVPIKDVKTYIRAAGLLRRQIPDLQALVLGPTEEDPAYDRECRELVAMLGLGETVLFKGQVKLDDWLGRLDAIVLTSISEAQPLVILEAGAAGVPTVATDVGACREMILGPPDETPALGDGGAITPLANPQATAAALAGLLRSPERLAEASRAIRERVRQRYNKRHLDRIYADLYAETMALPDAAPVHLHTPRPAGFFAGWRQKRRGAA